MNSSDQLLAGRYGRALFLAAQDAGDAAKIAGDLTAAQGALLEFSPVLKNPRVSVAEKKALVAREVASGASALTRKFLDLLLDKKRFFLLPAVLAKLGRFADETSGRARVKVWTARDLPESERKSLAARLEKFFGKTIEMDVKRDPDIIGGIVVRQGDWVLDSSLRGNLKNLGETLNGD